MSTLDDEILAMRQLPLTRAEAAVFLVGMKTAAMAVEPVAEPSEGEMLPEDQALMAVVQLISHELKTHLAYIFYAQMLRDLSREGLAEVFEEHAKAEIADASYLLRRAGVMSPNPISLPPTPGPVPVSDPGEILKIMIAAEQQAIVLGQMLHNMLGDDPMAYTIEQMLGDEQAHLDKLMQFVPAAAPAKKPAAEKVAAAIARIKTAAQQPKPGPKSVVVPEPGSEPVESYLAREQELAAAQAEAEKQDLAQRLGEAHGMLEQQQAQTESLTAENQQLQEQMSMVQQQADTATQQAQDSMTMAQQSSEQAAAEADAKMRLSMRIQQLRQQLAQIVSADPVMEEGIGFGDQAGPGAPVTPMQQQQAAAEQQEAEAMGLAPKEPSGDKAKAEGEKKPEGEKKEKAEAKTDKSKDKPSKDKSKGTEVTVKTSGVVSRLAQAVRRAPGAVRSGVRGAVEDVGSAAGEAHAKAFTKTLGDTAKATVKSVAADRRVQAGAAGAGALYAGSKIRSAVKQHGRDKKQDEILGRLRQVTGG